MSRVRYTLFDEDEGELAVPFFDSIEELEEDLSSAEYDPSYLSKDSMRVLKVEFLDVEIVTATTIRPKSKNKSKK
jgi:hypothetical protein